MKKFIIIILLLIVIIFAYFSKKLTIEEGFTPSLRKIYRPYVRRARITTESFYADKSTSMSNLFRRSGILF
jgi:uncharacterized protein YxeA